MKNYHRILGVSEDAEPEEIKAAYRKLAKKYHPDSHPDDPNIKKKFQEISEAYEALRKEWSHTRGHFQNSYREEPRPKWSFHREIRIPVHLDMEEILCESEKDVTYLIRLSHDLGYELLKCRVRIPKGTYQHKTFPLEEVIIEGREQFDKIKEKLENTDVIIIILLKEKKGFQIRGYHLYTDIYLDYADLVLGADIRIETIEGMLHYTIKPGTQAESSISLRNKGLIRPYQMGGRGNQYVRIHVRVPKTLTAQQQQLLERFREAMRSDRQEMAAESGGVMRSGRNEKKKRVRMWRADGSSRARRKKDRILDRKKSGRHTGKRMKQNGPQKNGRAFHDGTATHIR